MAFAAGQRLTAAVLNAALGDAVWTPYTPTLTQGATVSKTVTRAAYVKVGRKVTVNFRLGATSAGTAGGAIAVGLPFPSAADDQAGYCAFTDVAPGTLYALIGLTVGQTMSFVHDTSGLNFFGTGPAITIASGDILRGGITYEATS